MASRLSIHHTGNRYRLYGETTMRDRPWNPASHNGFAGLAAVSWLDKWEKTTHATKAGKLRLQRISLALEDADVDRDHRISSGRAPTETP